MKVWELMEVLKRLDPSAEIELSPIGDHLKDTANFEIAEPFLTRRQRLVFDPADIGLNQRAQYDLEEAQQSCDELRMRCERLRSAIEEAIAFPSARRLDALKEALDP